MIVCPVESPCRITQKFGENPQIYARFGLKAHNGVDITGPKPGIRVPVYSPYDALVWQVADQGGEGYGKHVRLLTDLDAQGRQREVVLAHFSSISVKAGQRVNIGDPIGVMGDTGFSTGLHLHLGIRYRKNGEIQYYGNGYFGYTDFEPYILYWKKDKSGMVSYA